MNRFFRRISLPVKLMLIGLVPLILLVYLALQFYNEKSKEVELLDSYIDRINQSVEISTLINELQKERRYSFAYVLESKAFFPLKHQRPKTDAAIARLEKINNNLLAHFTNYTFLNKLPGIRQQVDSTNIAASRVMDFYTNAIIRLNMLNVVSGGNNAYLRSVYKDLAAQQVLSQMTTYLGILRTNIYEALYTKKDMQETLKDSYGVYEIYQTFESEFLYRASSSAINKYKNIRNDSTLKPTLEYIDRVFERFVADSTYEAENWYQVSSKGTDVLRSFQQELLNNVRLSITELYEQEKFNKYRTLVLLILSLVVVFLIVGYTILVITKMLIELRVAAKKLARGSTGLQLSGFPNDAVGSLAESILKIDQNNKVLAEAADAIGNGDFNVPLKPRSSDDLLGNAIVQMKNNLQKITQENEESREQLRQLADFLPQIVWSARPDGYLDYYNKKWYDFTGFKEGYGDQSWTPILHPDDVQLCTDTWYRSVHSGDPYVIEYRFFDRRTKEYKWFLGKALPMKDANGKIIKWFGTCTEIQDQKKLAEELEKKVEERTQDLKKSNAELERSNKDLEQFAYVASHDLQEPVRKIRTFAEIIKDRSAAQLDEPSKNYIDKICSSAERMKNIIKDILNFSHLNKGDEVFEPTDLNTILKDITNDLELIITQKNAVINAASLPVIEALPVQMNQLFYNLINNALKFSLPEKSPVITIQTEAANGNEVASFTSNAGRDEYIKLIFSDNGIGFEQKYAEQIFTMFQRLNDRQTYSGTGIGLALCKKIVENHNGFIEAQSSPGAGATFVILLPVTQPK